MAAEFFAEQLADARRARRRGGSSPSAGFDRAAAEQFGVGFAPRDGPGAARHLRGRGFTDRELVAAGLVREAG